MIGNDVVDLTLAKTQSNWKRKGYLDKIFTNSEIEFIVNSEFPDETVWKLWSRKEAVYKIIIQSGGERGYYPKKIECLDSHFENGIVMFENNKYFTKSIINNALLHSIAVENKADFDKIIEISNSYNLIKTNGIPFYFINEKRFSATKSHHGKFEKILYLS